MALADIRTQIAATVQAVPGVGVVHEYERWVKDWTKFLECFKDGAGLINGGYVTRQKTQARYDAMPTVERHHSFVIRYYMGLNDAAASEIAFQDLIERMQNAFDGNLLGNTVRDCGPLQVAIVEPRVFGNVLCHFAEMHLPAVERRFCT